MAWHGMAWHGIGLDVYMKQADRLAKQCVRLSRKKQNKAKHKTIIVTIIIATKRKATSKKGGVVILSASEPQGQLPA
jgi:hypothetical protein